MIVQYGSYSFDNGECAMVNWTARPKLSPRNVPQSTLVKASFAGEFCFPGAVDQDAIKTKIQGAKDALDQHYQDLKLIHNDGTTESPYVILNSHPRNLTGNIVAYTSWPSNVPEDYATTKQFAFAVQAEFFNSDLFLLDYKQSVRIFGTAGPIKRWSRFTNTTWRSRQVHATSTKKITQYGYAVGYGANPLPATPLLGEDFEHLERRKIEYTGPSAFYSGPEIYRTQWAYQFETPFEFTWTPNYPALP